MKTTWRSSCRKTNRNYKSALLHSKQQTERQRQETKWRSTESIIMLREWTQNIWLHLCVAQEWSKRLTLQGPRNLFCQGQWKNEERTETQKIWNQLGVTLWWRRRRAPDLILYTLYTTEQGHRAIAHSWPRRQAYLISAGTVSSLQRDKKTMVGIVCIHC